MKIKTLKQLVAVLELLRKSQKEAARFPSKDRAATAKHWESVVDEFLGGAVKR
ncbi:MAG: hypothetical protein LBK27_07865 [Treponema sp.]|nr:hypothetical protein [Treponema sp.]